jgi:hypothetical protein
MRSRQLLAFRFGSDSKFEGQLVGAFERLESAGTTRVLDALFVAREPGSGELSAIALADIPASRRAIGLLDFRLDATARRAATRRALAGADGEAVQSLGEILSPGGAVAAVLLEHAQEDALLDAVARVGGRAILTESVDAARVSELMPRLLDAAERGG